MIKTIKKTYRLAQTKFSFGASSAIITNLGLIAGLRNGEYAKVAIIGSMLVIAVADNISDSVGIHIFQESECINEKEVWVSTCTNFLARVLVSSTFVLLIALLPIKPAVVCSIAWGLFLLSLLSYTIAKRRGIKPYLAVLEHFAIAVVVIILSGIVGQFVVSRFKL